MQKKDWFAPPALLAGGAASLIFFENGSRIVQYLLPRKVPVSLAGLFRGNVIQAQLETNGVGWR